MSCDLATEVFALIGIVSLVVWLSFLVLGTIRWVNHINRQLAELEKLKKKK